MAAGGYQIEFAFEGEEYKLPTVMLAEFRAIQKATGFTVKQFWERLSELDAEAITALIWIARRRQEPTLRFDDVDGDYSTFDVHDPREGTEEEDEPGKDPERSPTDAGPSGEAG